MVIAYKPPAGLGGVACAPVRPRPRAAARTGARESRSPSVAGLSAVSFLRDERSVPSGSAARRAQGMVKSVVVASSIEATFEARAASAATAASVEWGFLVGQAATSTHSKDYVLAIVPATESEGISSDDLVDQASQAVRMFVGGVQLLGLYQYGPDGTASLDQLYKHAAAVNGDLACGHSGVEVSGEWLALQVAFGARKYTAKSFGAGSSTTLRPAELKFQPLAGKLRFHSFTATLKIHLSTRLPAKAAGTTVTDRLRAAADAQCAAYEREAALSIDGNCADGTVALSALSGVPAADHGCVAHKVEIFAPNLGQPLAAMDVNTDDTDSSGVMFGNMTVHAVLHEKGTNVADAIALLWQDLRVSLRSRLSMQGEMLAVTACGVNNSSERTENRANSGVVLFGKPTPLPRRVLLNTSQAVPGVDSCYADYLHPDDSYADSAERVADVLGCLQGIHIMPLASANGEEEDGGVPEWVLTEEPTHHAKSSSDRRLPESPAASASAGGLSWPLVGLAGVVAVAALLIVAAPQL